MMMILLKNLNECTNKIAIIVYTAAKRYKKKCVFLVEIVKSMILKIQNTGEDE